MLPIRHPRNTPRALPRLAATLELLISSCSAERSGGLAPNLSARDSTYQADPIPSRSEKVFPSAAAAMVDIPNFIPEEKEIHWSGLQREGCTESEVDVLPSHDHYEVVQETKSNKGERVVVSQLLEVLVTWSQVSSLLVG